MPRAGARTTPPRRQRNARGEGTRLRGDIVSAAAELLVEAGDAGAITLRAVSRRAGIAAPSIYAHFENTQQILLAVVEEQFIVLQGELSAAVAAAGDAPLPRLRAWAEAYLGYAKQRPQHYLVMFGGVWVASTALEEHLVETGDVEALGTDLLALLTRLLAACVDAGISRSIDPENDAVVLWVGLHGLAQQRIVSPAFTWAPDTDRRLFTRLALIADDA